MRKSVNIFLLIGWIVIIIIGFLAYYVTKHDPISNTISDGLGREVTNAPFLARLLLLGSDRWAGLFWFFADYVIFWGWVAFSVKMFNSSKTE
jgi:hypothetical protein